MFFFDLMFPELDVGQGLLVPRFRGTFGFPAPCGVALTMPVYPAIGTYDICECVD